MIAIRKSTRRLLMIVMAVYTIWLADPSGSPYMQFTAASAQPASGTKAD